MQISPGSNYDNSLPSGLRHRTINCADLYVISQKMSHTIRKKCYKNNYDRWRRGATTFSNVSPLNTRSFRMQLSCTRPAASVSAT